MALPNQSAVQPAQISQLGALEGQAASHEMVCPDPSVHERQKRQQSLQDQAAGAAQYVTHHERATSVRDPINPLDADGKLSSASAALSLKYARAQDLPSFPSVGINRGMSAGVAANLAHKSTKVQAWPKPDASANAGKAAMLAKDYKMDPLWQPEASAAGSKAAILAAKGAGRDWWQAQPSKDGNSAAEIAMRKKLDVDVNYGVTKEGYQKALVAATLSVRRRKRSESTPERVESYPDAARSGYNAVNAATVADAKNYAKAMEASRITHLDKHITPKMFTEHPPIAWDAEEKKHDDALKASAISMAKKMYAMQKVDDEGNITIRTEHSAATSAQSRASTGGGTDIKQQALQYLSLQDAAQRLAAERLAKIQHPDESAAFRDYYGYPSRKTRSRLSVRGRNRDRASSEGAAEAGFRHDGSRFDYDSDDEEQARRIRKRQSQFNDQLVAVDKKREQDRKALLSAAEKKVHAQMHALDQKVFDDTGKMSPQMIEEWDAKARARATANSEARMQHHGKVNIGGGKFLDQSKINAIAQARIQPTLDQINDRAEKQRARDEGLRLDAEEKKRLAQEEKQRQAELKAEEKRARNQEKQDAKAKKAEEKQAARDEKDAAKAKRAEAKRLAAEEKRKSKEAKAMEPAPRATVTAAHETAQDAAAERAAVAAAETQPTTSVTSDPLTGDDAVPAVAEARETEPEVERDDIEKPAQPAPDVDMAAHRNASIDETASVPATASTAATPTATPIKPTIDTEPPTDRKVSKEKEKAKNEPEPDTKSPPQSSTKPQRGIGSILRKLKLSRKDKKREPGSFSGGAALAHFTRKSSSSARDHEPTTSSRPTVPKVNAPESSPSVSSLSSSDRELDPDNEVAGQAEASRGRSKIREGAEADRVSGVSTYSEDDPADFDEARDTLSPPPRPAFASEGIQKSHSPSRESRFREEVDL